MLFAGFLLVALSFVGCLWLSGIVGIDLYWPMAALWGGWAALDSHRHDLKRYERVFPLEPWALLAAVTIMWPVALPWYLRLRRRIRTGRLKLPTRPSRTRYVLVALAFLGPLAVLALPKLMDRIPMAADLSAVERAASDAAHEPVEVSLHSSGTLTVTVLHQADPREIREERLALAREIAEAVTAAAGPGPSFKRVRVGFAIVAPGARQPSLGDVFEWTVAELRPRVNV
jgi:hypothetical protein